MKLMTKIKFSLFAIGATLLPLVAVSADVEIAAPRNDIAETVRNDLIRLFADQNFFYFDAGQLMQNQQNGWNADASQNQANNLESALNTNENVFQGYISFLFANAEFGKNFSDILRLEASYFVSYVRAVIAGDAFEQVNIRLKWNELADSYAVAFAHFQPRNRELPEEIRAIATELRNTQINEAKNLGSSFVVNPNNNPFVDAINEFQLSLDFTEAMILLAVNDSFDPKDWHHHHHHRHHNDSSDGVLPEGGRHHRHHHHHHHRHHRHR